VDVVSRGTLVVATPREVVARRARGTTTLVKGLATRGIVTRSCTDVAATRKGRRAEDEKGGTRTAKRTATRRKVAAPAVMSVATVAWSVAIEV
jgi:hypothetical protein